MKKKLALVLAAAMTLTSLPTVAFAQSSNSISTVASAKEDTKFAREGSGSSASGWSAPSYIPRLSITSDSKIPIETGSKIRLHLTNAEWLNETNTNSADYLAERLVRSSDIRVTHKDNNANINPSDITVTYVDASTVEVTLGAAESTSYDQLPYDMPDPYKTTARTFGSGVTVTDLASLAVSATSATYYDANILAKRDTATPPTTPPTTPLEGVHDVVFEDIAGRETFASINGTINLGLSSVFEDALAEGEELPNAHGLSDNDIGNIRISSSDRYYDAELTNTTPDTTTTPGSIIAATPLVELVDNGGATQLLRDRTNDVDYFDNKADEIYVQWDEITITPGTSPGDPDTIDTVTTHAAVIYVHSYSTVEFDDMSNPNVNQNAPTINGDTVISIPMLVELTGVGDAIVRIESISGNVSTSPHTFATVSESDVKVTVSKTVTIPETGKQLENLIINEITPGSLEGEYYVRLKAPNSFYWDYSRTDFKMSFAGYYSGREADRAYGDLHVVGMGDKNTNEITLWFYNNPNTPSNQLQGLSRSDTIGTIVISGLILKPTDDARFGDVNVNVRGAKFSNTSVLVGAYKDYVVTMEPEDKDLPVILAGYMPGYANNSDVLNEDEVKALEVHISEAVPNSWWGLRKTTLSVPDGVAIRGAEIKFTKGGSYEELVEEYNDKIDIQNITSKGKFTEGEVTIYDAERLEFKGLKMKDDEKAEAWVKLYLSVEPGFTGDIDVTLSGGGLDEDITATVATAVNPVNVSMKQTEIKLGYKNIELNDITITENKAGAIRKEYYKLGSATGTPATYGNGTKTTAKMILQIGDTTDKEYLKFDSIKSYEVTEGDITLDSVKVRGGNIEIEVKNESDKPSTIVLKGVTGLADRVPPEGYYALSVGGTAIINNYNEDKPIYGHFDTEFFEVPKAYNVITAAPGSANEFNTYVQMKIDDTTMIVGSDTIQMDAAPYISEGRTMLPIRYVANAFGISDDNIHFDQNSKTVTLVTQNRTVQLTVGSRTILSNGTPIEMDVAAEITDGRTFIPVMWVATALGIAQPKWDEATRTVTFNGEYASNDALGSQVQDNSSADQVVSSDDADEDEE